MPLPFDIAGGSVAGHAHVAAGRNNQDAFCWAQTDACLAAVVCDGCGSAAHSDVGAKLGARLLVEAVTRLFAEHREPRELLERARADVVEKLRRLAIAMSVETERNVSTTSNGPATRYSRTVTDHFLFTVVGVIVADDSATTFALGDGLVVTNGERKVLGPYPNNEPPYLGYDLLATGKPRQVFDVHASKRLADVHALLIGTDGVLDLDGTNDEEREARELDQFWADDRIFRNPDMVRRRLVMMNRDMNAAGRHGERAGVSDLGRPPRLSDDTTLVVLRRRLEPALPVGTGSS